MVNGEQSQIAPITRPACRKPNTIWIRPWSVRRATAISPVLIRPGTYAAAVTAASGDGSLFPNKRQIVAQFRQNSLLRLKPGDEAEVVFNALPGGVSPVNSPAFCR